jgi:hypothetical protein
LPPWKKGIPTAKRWECPLFFSTTLTFHAKEVILARPNFQFEKRQKELARKRKKEEKRQARLDRKTIKPDATDPRAQDEQDAL